MNNVIPFPTRQYSEKELLLIFVRAFLANLKRNAQ